MSKFYSTSIIIIAGLFIQKQAFGIINVPSEELTIQAGIDVAVDGDTVLVSPGEYFENINLHGKNILLTSNYYFTGSYSDIENTIINGSSPVNLDTASTILIISGENENCIIQGFTITGGAGTIWLDEHGAGTYREGGGILMQYSSPVIRYNYIIDNHVTNETGVLSTGGGAMRCGDSGPVIINNFIANNEATGYGGGLVFNYCDLAIVSNNVIANNIGGNDYGGGGILATGAAPLQHVDIINNTIVNNTAEGSGAYGGKGGGIFVFTVTVNVLNSIIWGNDQFTGNAIHSAGGVFTVNYSDVQNDMTGTGNINADPQFLDTLMCFLTDTLSACVDAGNPDFIYNDPEDAGIPGKALYPSLGTIINDMGVNGGIFRSQISECPEIIPSVDVNEQNIQDHKLYPNPVSTLFNIGLKGNFSILITNSEGKSVYKNWSGSNYIQVSVIDWESGIYFYRILHENNKYLTGKFIVE